MDNSITYETWTFEDWVRGWFDHPDDWNWLEDGELPCTLSPTQTISYATRLFETAGVTLAPYSDHQIGQSLWAFINEIDSPLYALRDDSVSLPERCQCLSAVFGVYDQIFAPRYTESLGHLSEDTAKLNSVCYMWWDIFPTHGGILTDAENIAVLGVLERALSLPHVACQESALHGLGHWHLDCPKSVERIVDVFLTSGIPRRPNLIPYAKSARRGMVL